MKVFHCDHCGHLLFFENTHCVRCGRLVAYLPDLGLVASLDATDRAEKTAADTTEHTQAPAAENTDRWCSPLEAAEGRTYRLCRNYTEHQVCNWAVPE